MLKIIALLISSLILPLTSLFAIANVSEPQSVVITTDNIQWGYLNPARGDKSPGAANLWGDRSKDTATGMLVRFNKGFSSPPHIHNISYRGIVIKGLLHNDDPGAAKLWLPATSYWTQPAGENHITAADGDSNLIYLEIDSGPYLVRPTEQQFANGEYPVNVHADNLVWLDATHSSIIEGDQLAISYLWQKQEQPALRGYLVKLPASTHIGIASEANAFRAVVIQGEVTYRSVETAQPQALSEGSYFSATGQFNHQLHTHNETVLYVRSDGGLRIIQTSASQ